MDVTPFGCNVVGGMGEGGSTRSIGFARLRHSLYMFLLHLPHNCVLTLAFERSSLVPVSVLFLSLATWGGCNLFRKALGNRGTLRVIVHLCNLGTQVIYG